MRSLQGFGRLAAVLGVVTFLPNSSDAAPAPSNPPRHGRPGLPNSFALDYKLDRHLTERSEKSRDARETVDVIVTLHSPPMSSP